METRPRSPTRLPAAAGPAPAAALRAASGRRTRPGAATGWWKLKRRPGAGPVALAGVLGLSLAVRLWGVRQGLPYSYNIDEATHFVPRAVSFFSHDLNPHYFLNPPAYSYLLGIVFELWFGSGDAVARVYASDPSSLFVLARVLAALLGTAAVWLTYLAGRRLWGREAALLAAAILGLAFLPVFYSHLALNDAPTLAPVALSLWGIAGVAREGRWRDYLVAGAGIGLAAATKYTGGITAVCLLGAWAGAAAAGGYRRALLRLAGALGAGLVAFVLADPYAVLDWHAFTGGISFQAALAGGQDPAKIGTGPGSGVEYYVWSFTWGLGWGPSLAALGGALLLLARRRVVMALVLLPAPLLFIAFMGSQQRFFGRWLMPLFPLVALLAGWAAVELGRWSVTRLRLPRTVAAGAIGMLMLAPSLVSVVHDDRVLARPDTRNLTRAWMVTHVPAGEKIVIEPVVADNWASDIGTALPWTPNGDRWYRFATSLTDVDPSGRPLPAGQLRYVRVDQYERTLRPELIDEYVRSGFCWLVIGSLQAARALSQPRTAPRAVAYYAALSHRARLAFHISPFGRDARPVPFNFDWSIDYFPRQYAYPGPEMSVLQLRGGRCGGGA
ncbi:MAG TPA: glycosyltransferase family 39 protein [Solirubrobacteraceae bacterium]|nr:glycosyltransferase family 39 protein [Solirubrobacteraceae bacterium]